jgi:cytochrome c553
MMIRFLPLLTKINQVLLIMLFTGLLMFGKHTNAQTPEAEKNFQVCKACHNIDGPKLIGPNLAGVTERRTTEWLIKFIKNSQEVIQSGDPIAVQLFEEYNRIPMPPNPLSDDQIMDLLAYIENGGKVADEYAQAAPTDEQVAQKQALVEEMQAKHAQKEARLIELERDANRNFGTTFIITLIILIVVLFDLLVTKVIKARFVHTIIILVSVFIIGEILYKEATMLGRQQYYQPEQPVWFSHKIHAEQNKIDCNYCHSSVEKGKSAGIPSTQLCMNCHNVVRSGKITGTVEIAKVLESWETGKPIEWIRIHNLPDHVYFNHAQHVQVGKLDCAECHGQVEKMDEVMQVHDLSMGWCLECHRKTEVQFTSNSFYATYEKLHEQLKNGQIKKVTADMVGGDNCMKCHY